MSDVTRISKLFHSVLTSKRKISQCLKIKHSSSYCNGDGEFMSSLTIGFYVPVTHSRLFLKASFYFKHSKPSDKGLIHNIALLVLVKWTLLSQKA